MKFPLPAGLFPALELSPEDKRMLEDSVEAVVKNAIGKYHEHLTVGNGVVDEKRWKKIKEREDVRVYRERKLRVDGADETTSNSSESSVEESKKGTLASAVSLLTFGTIQGTLDDVMYGVLNPSIDEMQLKSAYVEDGFVDWALLASIIKPSEKDPFRELSLKWNVKCHSLLVGIARDNVFMEASGIAVTPNGERIGYHVKNSVEVPDIRILDELNIVRVKLYACEFFRQRNDDCVEVNADSHGRLTSDLAASTNAEVAVSLFKHVHYAEMKKLTHIERSGGQHLLRNTIAGSDTSSYLSSSSDSASRASSSVISICAQCAQSASGSLSFSSSKLKQCRVCSAWICSRCRVVKTIYPPAEVEKQLTSVNMLFCTRCIQSSATFAVLDALAADGKYVDYSEALR